MPKTSRIAERGLLDLVLHKSIARIEPPSSSTLVISSRALASISSVSASTN
jgi:hypothetical protein